MDLRDVIPARGWIIYSRPGSRVGARCGTGNSTVSVPSSMVGVVVLPLT